MHVCCAHMPGHIHARADSINSIAGDQHFSSSHDALQRARYIMYSHAVVHERVRETPASMRIRPYNMRARPSAPAATCGWPSAAASPSKRRPPSERPRRLPLPAPPGPVQSVQLPAATSVNGHHGYHGLVSGSGHMARGDLMWWLAGRLHGSHGHAPPRMLTSGEAAAAGGPRGDVPAAAKSAHSFVDLCFSRSRARFSARFCARAHVGTRTSVHRAPCGMQASMQGTAGRDADALSQAGRRRGSLSTGAPHPTFLDSSMILAACRSWDWRSCVASVRAATSASLAASSRCSASTFAVRSRTTCAPPRPRGTPTKLST